MGIDNEIFAKAHLIRSVEQRLLALFSEGKLFGTVHTCIGQEMSGVAVAEALVDGDLIFSNHRCHGHFLARTDDVNGLIAELMGKQSGVCGGRGGSQHLCAKGFFSNGIQGGIVPVSTGLALSQKMAGGKNLTVVFIGDGTLGEGAVYEAMNVASKWDLPLLIVLENNLYAQSTSQSQTLAGDICARAEAFGIRAFRGSTWVPDELMRVAATCVAAVRDEGKPAFLRIDTYRLMAHSKGDDDRDTQEVGGYWSKDPLAVFLEKNPAEAERLKATVKRRIDAAVALADDVPYTAPQPPRNDGARGVIQWTATSIPSQERVVVQIRDALRRAMEKDPRIVLVGEDIESPYGGAFKATKGLSDQFPGRVRNTPISESLIVGLGNGLALNGMIPVCEIMFGDFLTLCADQIINHASKFRYMYNEQVSVPVIIRTPMGGKRGYGPTHSQSIEKHFLGIPGTQVLAIHHRYDPGQIYDDLFRTIDRPTIVIENKLLYAIRAAAEAPAGFVLEHTNEPLPTTRLRPGGKPDITILCYGGMLKDVEEAIGPAFDQHEIACEVICPVRLYPLDPWPIIESVRRSGRLLIVEEGLAFAAAGSEIISQIVERAPGILKHVKRLASPEHPIPSCGPLEKQVLPNVDLILAAILEMNRHV
jgi:2-oxoisovalerate dehydrogenase E1 component